MAAVKVIKGKVIHDENEYVVDDVVKGLSKKDHDRLVEMGIGVSVDVAEDETPPNASDKPKKLTKADKEAIEKEAQKLLK